MLWIEDWMDYFVYQGEVGEQGTYHFQGYCELTKRMTFGKLLKLMPECHLEPRRGTQAQAITYATKVDTRVDGPYEFGHRKEQGMDSSLREIRDLAKEGAGHRQLIDSHPETYARHMRFVDRVITYAKPERKAREVILLYGGAGSGKTKFVLDRHPMAFVIPITCSQIWFDGYDGHEVALIDDFNGQIPLIQFLRVLHEYPEQVPIKGGHVWWNPSIIYITTNYAVRSWYDGKDGNGWAGREESYNALNRRITSAFYFQKGKDPVDLKLEGKE